MVLINKMRYIIQPSLTMWYAIVLNFASLSSLLWILFRQFE